MALGEIPSSKKVTMFHQIQQAICSLYYDQKITPVIMLDEIQMLSTAILEDLRLLFNFKLDSENPFILILSGQPLIRNKLGLSVNSPLKQRIAIKHVMQGLKKEETEDYLAKRLRAAGSLNTVFTSSAAEAIYSQGKGIPRLVNNLATSSLMYACSVRREQVDEEIVYQGQKDFDI